MNGAANVYTQADYEVRCEWGLTAVNVLSPNSDVVVIVDVLSFCTSVEIAVSRGAIVYPYRWNDESAAAYAESLGAELAVKGLVDSGYSLSPTSLLKIPAGTSLVLPSPNGSTLSLATGGTPTLAGCLRNFRAAAAAAQEYGSRIAVIPAGERWADGNLRPALEDWIGAGAIISQLAGRLSPEAAASLAVFRGVETDLTNAIRECSSGKELVERGFESSLALACEADVSNCVPVLVEGAYVAMGV